VSCLHRTFSALREGGEDVRQVREYPDSLRKRTRWGRWWELISSLMIAASTSCVPERGRDVEQLREMDPTVTWSRTTS
jgi:hypothetical protein